MKQRNGWLVNERRVTFLCRWLEITLEATTVLVIAVPMILPHSRGSCQGRVDGANARAGVDARKGMAAGYFV